MTEWITPRQVAEDPRLPVGNLDFVYRALKSGQLEGSRIGGRIVNGKQVGGRWVTTWEAVEAWISAGSNSVRRRKNRGAA